jgi:hypothetical protein
MTGKVHVEYGPVLRKLEQRKTERARKCWFSLFYLKIFFFFLQERTVTISHFFPVWLKITFEKRKSYSSWWKKNVNIESEKMCKEATVRHFSLYASRGKTISRQPLNKRVKTTSSNTREDVHANHTDDYNKHRNFHWEKGESNKKLYRVYFVFRLKFEPNSLQLLGFWTFPSSGILDTRKYDFSEAGSVSVLRWGGEDFYSVGSLERTNLSHWTTPVKFTQLFNHLRPG